MSKHPAKHIYATSGFPGEKNCETCINCESEIENQYPRAPNPGVVYAAMWGNGRHCRVRADLPGTSPGMFDDLHGLANGESLSARVIRRLSGHVARIRIIP